MIQREEKLRIEKKSFQVQPILEKRAQPLWENYRGNIETKGENYSKDSKIQSL